MPVIAGKQLGPIGYGLLGLTDPSNPIPEDRAIIALKAALESGCNFWNAGECYGTPTYNSLTLLNKYFSIYPQDAERVVLSVKGALSPNHGPDGSAAGIKASVENCLRILEGKKFIDTFECARIDSTVAIEDTAKTLAKLIKEEKIGGYMLCEPSAEAICRAHAIHPVSGVELELSLCSTDPLTSGAAEACAQLSIPLIAYSPIGRGMLAGRTSLSDVAESGFRRQLPRFQTGTFEHNMNLVSALRTVADAKGCTPAQLAIAWVKARSGTPEGLSCVPIPGASSQERVRENAMVNQIQWTDEDENSAQEILNTYKVDGTRVPLQQLKYVPL